MSDAAKEAPSVEVLEARLDEHHSHCPNPHVCSMFASLTAQLAEAKARPSLPAEPFGYQFPPATGFACTSPKGHSGGHYSDAAAPPDFATVPACTCQLVKAGPECPTDRTNNCPRHGTTEPAPADREEIVREVAEDFWNAECEEDPATAWAKWPEDFAKQPYCRRYLRMAKRTVDLLTRKGLLR